MKRLERAAWRMFAAVLIAVGMALPAAAQDKVKVGVFPISSSLPYFVALDLGYFKELNLEPETIRLMGGPPNVAAMITNQIEVSAVLVTLEGLNADLKKGLGVAMYIAMHSQNVEYKMEQFVARNGVTINSLADFKGKKLMSAPGPANLNHREGHPRQGRPQRGRLHHRSARYGPACECDEGRHLRWRLHARTKRHHHPANWRRQGLSRRA